jgi:hypothetical protein
VYDCQEGVVRDREGLDILVLFNSNRNRICSGVGWGGEIGDGKWKVGFCKVENKLQASVIPYLCLIYNVVQV